MSHQHAPPAPTPSPAAFDYERIRKDLTRKLGSPDAVTVLIEQKLKELNGLITPEAALLVLAKLQGVDAGPSSEPSPEPGKLPLTTVAACQHVAKDANVHLHGALVSMTGLREATRKDGTKSKYRIATFGDKTGEATLMLWGSDAEDADSWFGKLVILENVKVAFYLEKLQLRLTKKSHVHIVGGVSRQASLKSIPGDARTQRHPHHSPRASHP
jgi:hypothetical protein